MASGTQTYNFKGITTIPTATALLDTVLSETQRRTPTEVHKQFKISRIRKFYMRKVKYVQQAFRDRLQRILSQLPQLDDIHPFYSDLFNVLYDRDHYKLALGHCNAARRHLDKIAKEHVGLIKFAISAYRCKSLKVAGLGRMAKVIRKLAGSLKYLEDVRQHMSRLPSINPYTRTLLLTGYPNVGKSSFMNKVSKANVDVQPYSFTTKSLYVGHFDHDYLRWQVIDTPGLLDHPLDERNTIEMTAITALAHIYCAVLFFIDVSESCGYSIEQQVALFESIRPLFKDKPTLVVLNKIDLGPFDMNRMVSLEGLRWVKVSALTGENVDDAKIAACRLLLESRLEKKLSQAPQSAVLKLAYVTNVTPNPARPPTERPEHAGSGEVETEKQLEAMGGGPGVYSVDQRKHHILADDDWKYDEVPEIYRGRNVVDYAYPGNEETLRRLEKEEELLLRQLADDTIDDEWEDLAEREAEMHSRIRQVKFENSLKRKKGGPVLNETIKVKKMRSKGKDRIKLHQRASRLAPMPIDTIEGKLEEAKSRQRQGQGESVSFSRPKARVKVPKGTFSEHDRTIAVKRPKHMFTGKRTLGKTSRR
ncbi:nucleolar GTP-binding protein 1, putative [Babesia bigemina]|uniref:Nucleolar GTP-binding protein 1 n=1 Tax=Babesia bigemina TaxID=5866 RepID=A0A061D9E2_BABBI|nr:nucleolar GTP-binding protein 1, putative [Babesia bigemina]CDR97168.1 nucleolar GTP-binding protein 1, putative [Babesia bigemina]|eukprot:XP_012769354.1 nucleolar GTP-binding protein 1, putative [Babesia bigemina]